MQNRQGSLKDVHFNWHTFHSTLGFQGQLSCTLPASFWSPYWEAGSCSGSPRIRNVKVQYCIHMRLWLEPHLSQSSPSMPILNKWSLLFSFS